VWEHRGPTCSTAYLGTAAPSTATLRTLRWVATFQSQVLSSCRFGALHNNFGGSATFSDLTFMDSDSIEVLRNQVAGICRVPTTPPQSSSATPISPPTRSGVTQQASARSPAWFLIRAPNRRPRSPLPPTIRPIWDTGCSAPTAASSTFSGRSGSGSPVPVSSVAPRSTAPASRWPTRRPAWLSSDRGTTPASCRTTSDRPGRSPGSPWFRWGRLLAGRLGRRCLRPRRPPARPAAPSFGSVGALTVNRSTGQLTA
jgi:hypothetical protein